MDQINCFLNNYGLDEKGIFNFNQFDYLTSGYFDKSKLHKLIGKALKSGISFNECAEKIKGENDTEDKIVKLKKLIRKKTQLE